MFSGLALLALLGSSVPANGLESGAPAAGAKTVACANTRDDDEKINSAVAASADGDEIVIDGPCLIDGTIRLRGQRSYRGQSRSGTVIQQADGANLDAMLASDSYLDNAPLTGDPVTLRSLNLIANRAGNPNAKDALVLRSWGTVVEDMEILQATRHGIRLTNLSANGTPLNNTQVNGRIAANHVVESGGRGIFVEDTRNSVTDWHLLDNWIAGAGSDGIGMDNAAGWNIHGNHVYDVGATAITAERLFGSMIGNNYIENFATTGVRISVQGETASTITANRIFKLTGGSGVFLTVRVNYGTGNLAVTGNTIRGNGAGTGLDYQNGQGTGLVVASTGNLVTEVTTPRATGPGVTVTAGV
ncbi:right-handed parallel beta-helix repeat-containing protein [Amycolatopsis alba DSM 44262]|uniref:Right-handed parallel beta-helix repeat-containing protein n=1 Tax=Amycolatopsis alba DSM 44262 TaxID=1125972 RepID=A0A229S7M2_AMYAL|nr:right-handed parallel beta-helix repeat-containing protein [Amycolatopsis alba DSM 44262]